MNILIVEDDQHKLDSIEQLFLDRIKNVHLHKAQSYNSGLKAIESQSFDLIVLDMTIPTYDRSSTETGGRPRSYGGSDLLRQMARRNLSTQVVIVTQFEAFGEAGGQKPLSEVNQSLKERYPFYVGSVYYDPASDEWKRHLNSVLSKITSTKPRRR